MPIPIPISMARGWLQCLGIQQEGTENTERAPVHVPKLRNSETPEGSVGVSA